MVNKILHGFIFCMVMYMLVLLLFHASWTRRQREIREHEIRTWNQTGIIEVINKQY